MALGIRIEPQSAVPLWHQIETGLRRLIQTRSLAIGMKVPSVRDLARDLRVNPATVVKAYKALIQAGLLEVRRGEGTFVSASAVPSRAGERRQELREAAAQYADRAMALGASTGEAVKALRKAWPNRPAGGGGDDDGR
jgi:DNA-binding transcriptional regulator YhcF (GntR family)